MPASRLPDGMPDADEPATPGDVPADDPEAELGLAARNATRKLLTLLLAGAAVFALVRLTPLGQFLGDRAALAGLFKGGGWRADLGFVLVSGVLVMVGVPRLLLCALAGWLFGLWWGVWWSTLGSLLGSFAAFRAARWGGQDWLRQRFGGHRLFGRIVHARPDVASVVLIRMLPVNNLIGNVALALSRVRNRAFLIGSLIGFLPQGIVATLIGSGVAHDVPWAGAAQLGLAAALLLGVWLWSRRRR